MASPDEWFNQQIEKCRRGELPAAQFVDCGCTADFRLADWRVCKIMITQAVLRKAQSEKHEIDDFALANLPTKLAKPIMIFRSPNGDGSFILMLDAKSKGEPLVAILRFTDHRNLGLHAVIPSIHRRPIAQIKRWMEQGYCAIEHKERSQAWLQDSAPCN